MVCGCVCPRSGLQARQRAPPRSARRHDQEPVDAVGRHGLDDPARPIASHEPQADARRRPAPSAAHGTWPDAVGDRPGPGRIAGAERRTSSASATAAGVPVVQLDRHGQALRRSGPTRASATGPAEARCIAPAGPLQRTAPASVEVPSRAGPSVGDHARAAAIVARLGAVVMIDPVQRRRAPARRARYRPGRGAAGTARRSPGRGPTSGRRRTTSTSRCPRRPAARRAPRRACVGGGLGRGSHTGRRASPSSSQARRSSRWPIQMPKSALIHEPAKIADSGRAGPAAADAHRDGGDVGGAPTSAGRASAGTAGRRRRSAPRRSRRRGSPAPPGRRRRAAAAPAAGLAHPARGSRPPRPRRAQL